MPWQAREWCSDHLNRSAAPRFDAIGSGLWAVPSGSHLVSKWIDEVKGSKSPLWTVTTFNRAESCESVIRDLAWVARDRNERPRVVVIEDCSDGDYSGVSAALDEGFGPDALHVSSRQRMGKHEFWKTHQFILDLAARLDPAYLMSLQDDLEFAPDFLDRALSIWHDLDDPNKALLNLFHVGTNESTARWIRYKARTSSDRRTRKTQWFDLNGFIAFPRALEAWNHRVFPIDTRRWQHDTTLSSGVGRQLTRRLYLQRANIYQVVESLVYHGGLPSEMNPEQRAIDPLDNRPLESRLVPEARRSPAIPDPRRPDVDASRQDP